MNDNRISGKFSNIDNININQGQNNKIIQSINSNDIDKLFEQWFQEINENTDIPDKIEAAKEIEEIKDCVKNEKLNIAKKLFTILPTAIQTVSSALSIASMYNWIP